MNQLGCLSYWSINGRCVALVSQICVCQPYDSFKPLKFNIDTLGHAVQPWFTVGK